MCEGLGRCHHTLSDPRWPWTIPPTNTHTPLVMLAGLVYWWYHYRRRFPHTKNLCSMRARHVRYHLANVHIQYIMCACVNRWCLTLTYIIIQYKHMKHSMRACHEWCHPPLDNACRTRSLSPIDAQTQCFMRIFHGWCRLKFADSRRPELMMPVNVHTPQLIIVGLGRYHVMLADACRQLMMSSSLCAHTMCNDCKPLLMPLSL